MLTYCLSSWALIVIIFLTSGWAIELSEDGGYSGIVIKIQNDVPEDSCATILKNLQELIPRTSDAIGTALDGRVWLEQLTVVVPNHWRQAKCSHPLSTPKGNTKYKGVDILIRPDSSLLGAGLRTQQSRGCGGRGDFVNIPASFLTDWNNTLATWGSPAKHLAHEWMKLRYGIFDEFGFAEDPLYPNYYKVNGKIWPTGSSNAPVIGTWLSPGGQTPCNPVEEKCLYQPQGANDRVTCSLGYLTYLPAVTRYCRPEEIHFPMSPTKHNVICEGRSALEVILGNEDFKVLSNRAVDVDKKTTKINVVREPTPQYVMVIETSATMADDNDWKFINKAAHKLIRYDMPDGARMGVVTFSNRSRIEHSMVRMDSPAVRRRLADSIPDKYRLAQDDGRCVLCGFEMAVQEVLGDDKAGGHIVLVTRGNHQTLSLNDEKAILEFINYYQIEVTSIIVPSASSTSDMFLTFYDDIARLSGGRTHVIKEPVVMKRYLGVMEAFSGVLGKAPAAVTVHRKFSRISRSSSETSGSFLVDRALGRETMFGIYVEDEEDHLIKSITFTDSAGAKYGPYTRIATTFDTINLKTINYALGEIPPFNDPGHVGTTWKYRVSWHQPPGSATRQDAVVVTSKPRNAMGDTDLSVQMWTNSDSAVDSVTSHHPLAVYVSVTKGGQSVLGAGVSVDINIITDNGKSVRIKNMFLYDNGNGDPDMMSNDGVYSRYVTQYPSVGRYSFEVTVSDNDNEASVVKEPRDGKGLHKKRVAGVPVCCGSKVPVSDHLKEKTGPFERTMTGSVINLLEVPKDSGEDRMPPSKIGDLKVQVFPESQSLLATWTAPGDDFDSGVVSGYKFVFSKNISELLDHLAEPKTLLEFRQNDTAGTATSYQFKFAFFNEDFYIGLVGEDESNNTGKVSNLVSIVMPAAVVGEAGPSRIASDGGVKVVEDTGDGDWTMIGALCGAILILALCLMLGVLYFLKIAKPKKPIVVVNVGGRDDNTDNSSCSSDPKNTSSHQLMPDVATISGDMATFAAPPSSLPDSTPTYWSASQLLTEHEQRALNLSYGALMGPLHPIREEYIGYPEEYPAYAFNETDIIDYNNGSTNYGYRETNGTPRHGPYGLPERTEYLTETILAAGPIPEVIVSGAIGDPLQEGVQDRHSAASSNQSESVISVGSALYRSMGGTSIEGEPLRYSTGVQTVAPSTTAQFLARQGNHYQGSLKTRNVSLV